MFVSMLLSDRFSWIVSSDICATFLTCVDLRALTAAVFTSSSWSWSFLINSACSRTCILVAASSLYDHGTFSVFGGGHVLWLPKISLSVPSPKLDSFRNESIWLLTKLIVGVGDFALLTASSETKSAFVAQGYSGQPQTWPPPNTKKKVPWLFK